MRQEHGKQGDARITNDANFDKQACIVLGRESAKGNGARECHDLGNQQRQKQACRVQAQGFSVGGCHIDNGVHAVDKEEESNQVHKNVLVFFCLLKGVCQLAEGGAHRVAYALAAGSLAVLFHQRQAANCPPKGGDHKRYDQRRNLADTKDIAAQHRNQAHRKGNYRADITQGIAQGGYSVHFLVGGDLRQHSVIEHDAAVITHSGDDKDHQKGQPVPRHA